MGIVKMPPSAIGCESDCKSRSRWFEPRSGHILSLRFGHEKNSTTILTSSLIQGQLSVTGEQWALIIGKLPRRLAQEQCGWVN